jgi:SAM-dependent methyltransferase
VADFSKRPICPACGSGEGSVVARARDTEYCTSDRVYSYVECDACGTLFLLEPPVDALRSIYPPTYYSYQQDGGDTSWLQSIKSWLDVRMFRRLLDQLPGDALRVLDVGGGSGWLLSQVREASPRVAETHEVDIDPGAAEAAQQAGHRFHCVTIEEFEAAEPFDLVLMLNIIEHVADPERVLRAVERCLRPGGLVLIKTPNAKTLDRWIFEQRNWGGFHCPRHFVVFTRASFLALAARSGLDCLAAEYTQGAPQWTTSVLGWLSLKGWVTVRADKPMYHHALYGPLLALFAAFDFIRRPFAPTAQMWVTLRKGGRQGASARTSSG